jgi:hypothetical protein
VLIFWLVLNLAARSLILRMCRWFCCISDETYDNGTFYGMMYYKIAIILLMLVPYIALKIMK